MRKISIFLAMVILFNISLSVKAESLWQLYKRDPQAFYEKMMCIDEESKEKGYYTEAKRSYYEYSNDIPAGISDNEASVKIASEDSSQSEELNKGYVYGNDELHVVGTPSDSRGYTAAGDYTNKQTNGKGWVYSVDELHVVGLPTNPSTGYTKAGYYGNIE